MKITGKIRTDFLGLWGYFDIGVSIQRIWKGDTRHATWRHITIGLRSPLLRQPGKLYKDGKPRWHWWPLRFGWGSGNLYLGAIYIITTFGRQYPPLDYRQWGPFVWASQPTMDDYIGRRRR